ncbi:MAG TPA: methylene-tetrahydromethanopterin dehydrogenase N-terminal domain-containing protein [Solirubrobacteraceae bacterium]|jgi:methylenetetrahydrofolate/methylenetetrahydromethanopterin dehydrogenase (NADP+)|nr:methylene-tetrahydromethanopterin dehydrogenase N-terminal domain-containing protein [Solirubrobacteraceae bacterium]
MKQILIQLDTDQHPSSFDAIAAYDAGVDIVVGYGQVTPDNLAAIVQGAIFPRGPDGLKDTAFWVGGSKVRDGEAVFEAARKLFFGPFEPSIMLDSDGSNTTAAGGLAIVRGVVALKRKRAAVIGVGPVGLRTAELLRREEAEVTVLTFPPDVFEGEFRRASGISVAQDAGFDVTEPDSSDELDAALAGHVAVFAAGPAGVQVLRRSGWQGVDGLEVVVDYSAADPVGVEGVERDDDLAEEDGVRKLGALAVGGPKMKLQKRCVKRMFETKGTVMDLNGVYDVALEVL